jgi:hypothetical protein
VYIQAGGFHESEHSVDKFFARGVCAREWG